MLNNLFKVCWKWKNAHIICYKLTSLVSLQQGKKSKKLIKIDENSKYWQRKNSHVLKNLSNFNKTFRRDVTYVIIKSHKKTRTSPSLRKIHFSNIYRGVKLTHSLFRVKLLQKKQFRKQQKQLVTWLVIEVSIKLQRIYNRIIQQLIHKQKNRKQLKHENIYAYLQKKIASYWWYRNNVII